MWKIHGGSRKALIMLLLLLLSRFSHVQLCATPETAAHQAPPSLGFSRQEHWSGLPFPSPMHESEKWKWSRSVLSDSSWPHGLQPTRLLRPWDFPGKSTGVGCHCLLRKHGRIAGKTVIFLLRDSKMLQAYSVQILLDVTLEVIPSVPLQNHLTFQFTEYIFTDSVFSLCKVKTNKQNASLSFGEHTWRAASLKFSKNKNSK